MTHLADNSIVARKLRQADGTWALAVSDDQAIAALRALSAARMLRSLEVQEPEGRSMLAGREEQRFRHERALSREIERTIATVPQVLETRVHLNLPVIDPLFGQRVDTREGSASVVVVVDRDGPAREEIAQIVAGASGIPLASVTVMMGKAPEAALSVLPLAAPREAGPDLVGDSLEPAAGTDHAAGGDLPQSGKSAVMTSGRAFEIGASLLVLGIGLALLALRRGRASKEFVYDVV